ncbi:glycoside hydrolase [Pontibacillus halophilus JSM 076056 = DSM 19796]|uniref:Glycoside hydrolase n=1 Tax=Pontibacillus halophilus JSM 076056 = DSM 19796 TaxID=1385510 RepID=A0A0A5I294_9BACI|nr:glycosyltransferase [Pontibacillus halophilus]KGX89962.1 glycoside hydrolase [Pontibacillus halophilus JSM 076056 = DSM 19796]
MNKRIGVCGSLAFHTNQIDGQTIKTKNVYDELIKYNQFSRIFTTDTFGWRKNPVKLLINAVLMFFKSDILIILPGKNGLGVFIRLFVWLNLFSKKNIRYIVIGGWLSEYIDQNPGISKYLNKLNGIYVESLKMKSDLETRDIKNVKHMPNFKRLDKTHIIDYNTRQGPPYRFCTFSRVTKSKGIEEAIKAVTAMNFEYGYDLINLDIYGPVDPQFKERMEDLIKVSNASVKYKGTVDHNATPKTLQRYKSLLFPTFYEGEGFPGTFIDAFNVGLPVIASDWKYNNEIIQDEVNGLLFPVNDVKSLQSKIIKLIELNNEDYKIICENALSTSDLYRAEVVIHKFVEDLL